MQFPTNLTTHLPLLALVFTSGVFFFKPAFSNFGNNDNALQRVSGHIDTLLPGIVIKIMI